MPIPTDTCACAADITPTPSAAATRNGTIFFICSLQAVHQAGVPHNDILDTNLTKKTEGRSQHLLQIAIDAGAVFHVAHHSQFGSWHRPSKIKGLRGSRGVCDGLYRSANKGTDSAGNL